jgi:hypothetical protein
MKITYCLAILASVSAYIAGLEAKQICLIINNDQDQATDMVSVFGRSLYSHEYTFKERNIPGKWSVQELNFELEPNGVICIFTHQGLMFRQYPTDATVQLCLNASLLASGVRYMVTVRNALGKVLFTVEPSDEYLEKVVTNPEEIATPQLSVGEG